jgi:RNA polymerase sigma-70 factor (ECF subfamily)
MNFESEPVTEITENSSASTDPQWRILVERIATGDPSAMEDLYRIFSKGVRFYLCRQLGPQDLDDKVHDIFLIITQAIQKGELRDPDRLMGYVRTIVRRQVAAHIDSVVQARRNQVDLDGGLPLSDHQPNPERSLIQQQNTALAKRILNSLQKRDREVLTRFYLQEQPPEQICREMNLTETQFRLIKSRAKARFGELGKRRLALRTGFRPQPSSSNI